MEKALQKTILGKIDNSAHIQPLNRALSLEEFDFMNYLQEHMQLIKKMAYFNIFPILMVQLKVNRMIHQ